VALKSMSCGIVLRHGMAIRMVNSHLSCIILAHSLLVLCVVVIVR